MTFALTSNKFSWRQPSRHRDRQAAEAEKKNSLLAFMDFRVKDIYALLRYRFAKQVLFWKKINKAVFEIVGFL